MRVKKTRRVRGIFVTGTGTGVGKTYVACLIARALKRRFDGRLRVFKPYLTGSRADAAELIRASGTTQTLKNVNPVFLKRPLAPLVAARMEKKRISVSVVLRAFAEISRGAGFVIVEGAGGLFVPVTEDCHMIDLIKKFGLPAVIVSAPGLGAINHTLLSAAALRSAKIKIAAVIISGYTGKSLAERTNPRVIKKYVRAPLFIAGKNAARPPKGLIECLLKKD